MDSPKLILWDSMSLKLTFNAALLTSKHCRMLTLTHRYRIYPDSAQQQQLIEWMEICRGAFNYALRETKDWCDSRKCPIDRCSLEKEYIISSELKFPGEIQQLNNLPKAKKEFPKLSEVPSQVLQQAIKQLHRGWEYFQERGFGFPRFKRSE